MNIGIIGSGALGLLWGARLAAKGLPTVLVTRTRAQQQQLSDQGIIYTNLKQETIRIPIRTIYSEDLRGRFQFDLIFVMVKQFQLAQVIPIIQQMAHRKSQILFWQNGLGHEDQINRLHYLPYTYAAVTTEGAWRKDGNKVVHTGNGETRIGSFPVDKHPLEFYLRSLFSLFSSSCSLYYDGQIYEAIWKKLVINSVINPLTAYYEIKNGELLQGSYRRMIKLLLEETVQVAHHQGISIHPEKMMQKVLAVCQHTAINDSSMLQDICKGAQTEIDYINGAVVRFGEKAGIATPINTLWVERIHHKEKTQRIK